MADGSTKPIEEVKVGDWVWAEDHETAERGPRQVLDTIEGEGEKKLIDVDIEGHILTATHDHPFWVESRHEWVFAEDLHEGDELLAADGHEVDVDHLHAHTAAYQQVFNLTVDGLHTYYVLAGDRPVLVHNCPTWGRPEPGQPHGTLGPGVPPRPHPLATQAQELQNQINAWRQMLLHAREWGLNMELVKDLERLIKENMQKIKDLFPNVEK